MGASYHSISRTKAGKYGSTSLFQLDQRKALWLQRYR